MQRRQKRIKKGLVAEINVVPYIDVMLVLLIIFMVTAPLLQQGVAVELPQAKANPMPHDQKEPIIISVDKEGTYYLNVADKPADPISDRLLRVRLRAEITRDPKRAIMVKGDQGVNYGSVVSVMALAQQAGAESVGLITEDTGVNDTGVNNNGVIE